MPLFREKTGFFSLRSKGRKEKQPKKTKKNKTNKQKNKQKKTNKEGLGPSEVALRATSPDPYLNPQKNQKQKKTTKQLNKQKNKKISQNELFSYQSNVFWWVSKNSHFLTTWPRKRAPPKHYKNWGFSTPIFEKQLCVTQRPFFGQKNQIQKFQVSFFLPIFFSSTTKTQQFAETPISIVF